MQEEEKIPHLLDKIDLTRFQLKDYRGFDEWEYRVPGQTAKPAGKIFEVIYNHTFNQDLLITHLDIQLSNREIFTQLLEIGDIEASKLTNRGMIGPVLRTTIPKSSREERSLIVPCISITQSLKVSLLLKKQFTVLFNDILSFKKEKNRSSSQQNVLKMIHHTIKAINICGYQLSTNTAASELVPLLNISQAFKHSNRFDQAAETDILVSLSLTSARRFVQAAESLRNASKFYVEKYISSKSSMDFTRIDKSWFKEDNRELQVSGFSKTFSSGRVLEGGRYLYKAAKIQLLLADTINQPTLLGQKLQAFNRANSFANGNISPSKIETHIDYQEVIYQIGPSFIPFLVKVLSDKSEIYKISALKSIQFFYENLGCTLGNFMPLILKTLISTYPSLKQDSSIKTEENLVERFQTTSRTKLLLDHTNHLLESLLSLLPGMSKKYLKLMFQEIIQSSSSQQMRNELRLYVLRFGERIIQLCGPDLQIGVVYVKYILAISEGKYANKTDINKHIYHNLIFFSQRVIELLKNKILKHYNKLTCLNAIANWVNETLISLCESQTVTTQPALIHALDLVISIYHNPKLTLAHPVEPIVYLLNTSLHEPKLPFEKILEAFIVLVRNSNRHDSSSQLACEIVERVLGRSKMSTLGLKQLKILQKVLQTVKQGKQVWLQQFLQCIPHSNFDEIYSIFDLLISRTMPNLDKSLISTIINTLFNQYTVKGKAHQQSKQLFISTLLKRFKGSIQLLFQICLFENPEPELQNYYSKKASQKDHGFDSKQFKLHSELFSEKINLLLLVLSKNQNVLDKLKEIFTCEMIQKLFESCSRILLHNHNFKIKSKILILIKHLTLMIGQFSDSKEGILSKICFCKVMLKLLRTFINLYKDSKLQYSTILNIGLIFQKITAIKHIPQNNDLEPLQKMDQEGIKLTLVFPLTFSIESFVAFELIAMWNNLIALLNSPLQSVREMLMLVLIHTFKGGFSNIHHQLRITLIQHFKSILPNSLQSNDHSERIMGIRILALLFGLGRHYKQPSEMLKYIEKNMKPFKNCLQIVIVLQDDWNEDVSHCSRLISRLCISRELRLTLLRKIKNGKKYTTFYQNANISFNLQDQIVFQKKQPSSFDILNNFDAILKADEQFNTDQSIDLPEYDPEIEQQLTQFRLQIQKINFNALDNAGESNSFVEEQQYYDPNEQKHSEKDNSISNKSEEEQLEFQDLGIIDVDDQEWGEQQNQVKITQKLPLKKVYKLSPNLGTSTKHRLRNKRMNPAEFEEDKIIIDELQGRINSPPLQHMPQPKIEPISNPQASLPRDIVQPNFQEDQRRNSLSDDLTVSEPKIKKEKKTVKKRKTSAK